MVPTTTIAGSNPRVPEQGRKHLAEELLLLLASKLTLGNAYLPRRKKTQREEGGGGGEDL